MKVHGAVLFANIIISMMLSTQSISQPVSLFAPDVISTNDDEFGGTMSPDGRYFFFCQKSPSTGRSSVIAICVSENINGKWSAVQIAPFSGKYRDFNPQFSRDGKRLYFMSTRPVKENTPKPDSDIWFVERTSSGWGTPVHLDETVNSPSVEYACSFTSKGDMYLSSGRDGKGISIYRSKFENGNFSVPEQVAELTDFFALDACIAPDESYMLFTSSGREDMLAPENGVVYPRSDIYMTSKDAAGKWSAPVRLPEPVNSTADDSSPFISHDGKTLFFASRKNFVTIPMSKRLTYAEFSKQLKGITNGFGNFYQVSTTILTNERH